MFTCQQMTELVTEYVEGRMPFWRRMKFQLHLGMCQHCREYVRQMKLTVKTLGQLPVAPVDASTRDELVRRFRNWKN